MKMNRVMAVAASATLLVASSCMTEEVNVQEADIAPEVLAAFDQAGFNTADIVKWEGEDEIAGFRKGYMVGGDVFVSEGQVFDLAPSTEVPGAEQYRTSNLVAQPRTISVIGYTGSCCALTSKMQTGLSWAINNYNRLNLSLNFTLSTGTNYQSFDITVYNNGAAGGGGSAGFPTNGNPYNFVQINAGTDGFSTNVNEHVIGHEIGHCIGFRHTDYFNRSISCSSGGNEGTAGVGAVHIPGTPTTNVNGTTSLMLACFNSGVDGEFTSSDITALNFLY